MTPICYDLARAAARFVRALSVDHRVLHAERLQRSGSFVLACTHVGHLEPALLSVTLRRRIHWVAREEFFRSPVGASVLRHLGAISIDRRGVPIRAVRRATELLRGDSIVGIFPEGGRVNGDGQAIHGGPIKGGAALLAMRAGVPIVPVVMIGVDRLQGVSPWLPGRRTTVTTLVGEPIRAAGITPRCRRREQRRALTEQLRRAFVSLHAEFVASDGGQP